MLLIVLNSDSRGEGFALLIGTSQFSGWKVKLSETELLVPIGSSACLAGMKIFIFLPEDESFYQC